MNRRRWISGQDGIHLADPTNLERVLFSYFSVQRRPIEPRPREVKWSRELLAKTLTDVERQAVAIIERQAKEGVNLTPRLSQSILDAEFNDGLLDDWGIHHLHLSDRVQANGFVERDGRLLFVMALADRSRQLVRVRRVLSSPHNFSLV
jgi:hypothetical protein